LPFPHSAGRRYCPPHTHKRLAKKGFRRIKHGYHVISHQGR
jgi:hypothetical protein